MVILLVVEECAYLVRENGGELCVPDMDFSSLFNHCHACRSRSLRHGESIIRTSELAFYGVNHTRNTQSVSLIDRILTNLLS